VLLALGFEEEVAQTAVRFSWGPEVGTAELNAVADAVAEAVSVVASITQ
jgi:cysteine desulfurase